MVGARVAKSIWSSRQSLPTHSGAVPAVDTIRCTLTDTSSLMSTLQTHGPARNSRAKQATLAL